MIHGGTQGGAVQRGPDGGELGSLGREAVSTGGKPARQCQGCDESQRPQGCLLPGWVRREVVDPTSLLPEEERPARPPSQKKRKDGIFP
ncbi:hypothetical protein D187_005885 [Cystobacter fuscus DSM 2262]|uniref:Uncharacterized protein n=1 Tax=Cystobacter fuscus (strain ATCC 25194 / DSM 2262 / NBRC 100088 / M29) TaxID=1242864 RepID=S9QQA8_CYSF2|nr:hypothetical protein D187_005885 [Cystobacter fuscus DSM 2262]